MRKLYLQLYQLYLSMWLTLNSNLSYIFLHKVYRSRGVPVYLAEILFVVHNYINKKKIRNCVHPNSYGFHDEAFNKTTKRAKKRGVELSLYALIVCIQKTNTMCVVEEEVNDI